jgi:hypothetical protein
MHKVVGDSEHFPTWKKFAYEIYIIETAYASNRVYFFLTLPAIK